MRFSPDCQVICAGSSSSKKMFYLGGAKYNVIGYSGLPARVLSVCWNTSPKLVVSTTKNVLFVLLNYFLISVIAPDADHSSKELLLS